MKSSKPWVLATTWLTSPGPGTADWPTTTPTWRSSRGTKSTTGPVLRVYKTWPTMSWQECWSWNVSKVILNRNTFLCRYRTQQTNVPTWLNQQKCFVKLGIDQTWMVQSVKVGICGFGENRPFQKFYKTNLANKLHEGICTKGYREFK